MKRPPTSKELPTDFQKPFHLTVSDSQPSKGPDACLVQLLEIYFLVLAVERSRSGTRFFGSRSTSTLPAEYTPSIGNSWRPPHPPSRLHSILWQRRLYPNLSYLFIRVKVLFATRCDRSASAAFPTSAYRMRAPANHFAVQMQPHHRFVATP